eukprot:scaffold25842_cov198-Amphora_coffeaeformis.AAC.4
MMTNGYFGESGQYRKEELRFALNSIAMHGPSSSSRRKIDPNFVQETVSNARVTSAQMWYSYSLCIQHCELHITADSNF